MPIFATYALWAFAAGAAIPVMAILNGALGRGLGGPQFAAVVLFAVGFVACCLMALAMRSRVPGLADFAALPPPLFLGGSSSLSTS